MMKTEIAKIDESSLKRAKELLLSGELVAFPTETVYGLGACAFNDKAVEKIFLTKHTICRCFGCVPYLNLGQ